MSSPLSTPRVGDGSDARYVKVARTPIHDAHDAAKRARPVYVARIAQEDKSQLSIPEHKRTHVDDIEYDMDDYADWIADQYGSLLPQSNPSSPARKLPVVAHVHEHDHEQHEQHEQHARKDKPTA
ncbi:MAG: hypothetical protein WC440_00885 [Candidatus Omnitrophota bacterium]|jgi:hypothetical protein